MASKQAYEVIVELKKEVLDPQGRAIQETLQRAGFKGVTDLKFSKRFTFTLTEGYPDAKGLELAQLIAKEYLANPVSEIFQINKLKE